MPLFYFDTDIRGEFSAPQYTRMRHRYRGVRESWKIDLEMKQTHYALTDLYTRFANIRTAHAANAELLFEGGASGVNDGTDTPITLEGLNDLISRVAALNARVKRLEK